METRTNLPPETPRRKLAFLYDSQGRRTEKTVFTLNTNAQWETASTHHFLYDGWNLVSEFRSQHSGVSTNHFVWGLDLSGTPQGAGGIGGLLAQISGGTQAPASVFFPAYDANGNITEYISTNGSIAARYEYDPFGNTIAQTGPEADNLPFRFSTKYTDNETGLVYYGYRFYSPELGRWPNRDPIGGRGGINLYLMLRSNPLTNLDFLGLFTVSYAPLVIEENSNAVNEFDSKDSLSCECIYDKTMWKLKCHLSVQPTIRIDREWAAIMDPSSRVPTEEHERNHFAVYMNCFVPHYEKCIGKQEKSYCLFTDCLTAKNRAVYEFIDGKARLRRWERESEYGAFCHARGRYHCEPMIDYGFNPPNLRCKF